MSYRDNTEETEMGGEWMAVIDINIFCCDSNNKQAFVYSMNSQLTGVHDESSTESCLGPLSSLRGSRINSTFITLL